MGLLLGVIALVSLLGDSFGIAINVLSLLTRHFINYILPMDFEQISSTIKSRKHLY